MNNTENDNPPTELHTAAEAASLSELKAQWRAKLTTERSAVSAHQQVAEATALAEAVATIPATTATCYVPFGSEPGSITLLDLLHDRGTRVLLPVIPEERGPLDWAEYTGTSSLAPGHFQPALEPTGPRLGPQAIAEADIVLTPALAVDRQGVRLGKGAGYYDRSLVYAADDARLIALIRDVELTESLPTEPHDIRMNAVLMPQQGLLTLPRGEGE